MANKKPAAPIKPEVDADGKVKPLKKDALVRLKNKFRDSNGVTYEPSRFGVFIPKGTVLPKTAEIVDPDYSGEDMDLAGEVPASSKPSTLPDSEAKTSLTKDVIAGKPNEKELEKKLDAQKESGDKLKL